MKVQLGKQSVDLSPFVKVAALWSAASLALIFKFASEPRAAAQTWAVFFGLSVTDLFFLVKTVAVTQLLMSDQGSENRTAYAIQAFTYGGLKLLCLGLIGLVMWRNPEAPSLGIILGLGALVVIPLVGGFWWSQIQLRSPGQ